jgi:DNA-binding GntR family transcriptional regulator
MCLIRSAMIFRTWLAVKYYNGALEADMKFHETLVELGGNKNLLHTYLIIAHSVVPSKAGQLHKLVTMTTSKQILNTVNWLRH